MSQPKDHISRSVRYPHDIFSYFCMKTYALSGAVGKMLYLELWEKCFIWSCGKNALSRSCGKNLYLELLEKCFIWSCGKNALSGAVRKSALSGAMRKGILSGAMKYDKFCMYLMGYYVISYTFFWNRIT